MHQRLGHRYTRSLLAVDNTHVWQNIELGMYTETFCASCQISAIGKKSRSKTPLNPNTPFKWMFINIIPPIYTKNLTKDTNFSNYLLIVDAYSNTPKLYGMENITTK